MFYGLYEFCYLVCVNPPTAPAFSQTTPTDINGQFLDGDTIAYSCDGDLTPDELTTITCNDNGPPRAVWSTTIIPDCSKLLTDFICCCRQKTKKQKTDQYFVVKCIIDKNITST